MGDLSEPHFRHPSLLSIHDVMPSTISLVKELLQRCNRYGLTRCTLLVVPGCDWRPTHFRQLSRWVEKGHELAGHGWSHRCSRIRGIGHRLHSRILSRQAAEHLSLSGDEISNMMHRCGQWFRKHGFEVPALYVPPAWALGSVAGPVLRQLPFQLVETLTGVIRTESGRKLRLPLVGFEADTRSRELSLRILNRLNQTAASVSRRPLRIAIHPSDHRLLMHRELDTLLRHQQPSLSYRVLT